MPIPRQTISAIYEKHSDTEATVATAAEKIEVTVDADAAVSAEITTGKDDDSEDLGANNIDIKAFTPELSYPDFFEYLTGTPMLCEVVCSMWEVALERDLRAQRVAALRGMNKYCFKRTRARAEDSEAVPNSVGAIPSLSPAPHHIYTTDESTGECHAQ